MAKYRITTLLASESIATAATKTIDINMAKPISRITVQTKCTNNGSTPTAHGAKVVSKIELVDGSDVLFSLSGVETQALNFYEEGEMPFGIHEFRNDVQNIQTFHLNFGRWLWDRVYALDPKRFSNLQLKITHNKANGGSSPDAGNLIVHAHVFEDNAPSPKGFLMSKEHFTYSLTNSAHEVVDLPTDYPIRILQVQSLAVGKQPWEQYNKIKLSTDNDAQVIINSEATSDLLKLSIENKRVVEAISFSATGSAVAHFVAPHYDYKCVLMNYSAALTNNYVDQDYGGRIQIVGDSNEQGQLLLSGLAPHGAINIQPGDINEETEWLDFRAAKSAILDITAGSSVGSSSTAEIVVQQARNY